MSKSFNVTVTQSFKVTLSDKNLESLESLSDEPFMTGCEDTEQKAVALIKQGLKDVRVVLQDELPNDEYVAFTKFAPTKVEVTSRGN